jgi:uncharacterized protein YndB with AHSA1/START domain
MGRKLLKIAAWIVAGIAALALLVAAYGAMLPAEHNFMRSVQLAQSPETVYQTIADYAGYPSWRPGVTQVERQPNYEGKETWRVASQQGPPMRMTVEQAIPPRLLVLRYVDEKEVADITWEFTASPIPGGCLVNVRERGRISGAFFRGMNKLFGSGKYADEILTNLARKFGQKAVIQ